MSQTLKEVLGGTEATVLSTELNGLANNASALSAVVGGAGVFNNNAGSGQSASSGDGYVRGYLTLSIATLGGNPTANTSLDVYFVKESPPGSASYEDSSGNSTPAGVPTAKPDASFQLDSGRSSAQLLTRQVFLPACNFKVLLRNNGTGQALNASGNTLKLMPATDQMV